MLTNPYLYDLLCEWRRWRGQRGKLTILLVGFALVCALLAMVLRFGQILFYDSPAWVQQEGHFYTVANQHDDGRQTGLNRLALQVVADTPGVEQVSWLSVRNLPLEMSNYPIQEPLAVFFEPGLFEMLQVPVAQNNVQETGVWLSERFWREQLQADPAVIGQHFYHPRISQGLIIRGVLPSSMDNIGTWAPDIWLADSYQRYTTPFDANSETMVDRFLSALPVYFGIFKTQQPLDATALTERLMTADLTVPGMNMSSEGGATHVYSGINLDPVARQNMLNQWQLLLLLVIGLGLVLALNTIMVFTSRFIIYQSDYRLMRILGAQGSHLLRATSLASLVKLSVIGLLSLVFISLFSQLFSHHSTYQAFSGNTSFQIEYTQWLAAWGLTAILFIGCLCLPLIQLLRRDVFSRATGGSRTKLQKWFAQGNLTMQLSVALLAMNLVLTLAFQQWLQFRETTVDLSTLTFNAQHRGSGLAVHPMLDGNITGIHAGDVAISSLSFGQPQMLEVEDGRLQEPTVFGMHFVSYNFFARLGVDIVEGDSSWQAGIMINETAARLLSARSATDELVGSSLDFGGVFGRPSIHGIVEDIPHRGRHDLNQPMVYFLYDSIPNSRSYSFYASAEQAAVVEPALKNWLQREMSSPRISATTSIRQVLASQESAIRNLFISALVIVALVMLSILISLGYQIKARLTLERHEYGVLLAIGAPDHSLLWKATKQSVVALLMALPVTLFIQAILLNWLHSEAALAIVFHPLIFTLSAVVILLLSLLTAQLPIKTLLRQPIFNSLRQY